MSTNKEQRLQDLMQFLRTTQKPNISIDQVDVNESLVASGLIDSLTLFQIVVYLEDTYGINFSEHGLDPGRLESIASIVDFIEEYSE